ncbi:MAG: hypothetical protein IK105_09255 [Thermoguttaceae bacterium]|nr:hypothetical protein [Thermoguttaceae bacterium]MBR6481177.1 hypothetical protein [Thermoguttaceae bacterium]
MAFLDGNLNVTGTLQAGEILGIREVKQITGDGETVNFFLSHTLGVKDVSVSVYAPDGSLCLVRIALTSVGNFVVQFVDPPAEGETFNVIIHR